MHSKDSSEQVFRVTIMRLDTFSFSFENGYKGRASLVEYSGTTRHTSALTDSLVVGSESQNENQTRIKQVEWNWEDKIKNFEAQKYSFDFRLPDFRAVDSWYMVVDEERMVSKLVIVK